MTSSDGSDMVGARELGRAQAKHGPKPSDFLGKSHAASLRVSLDGENERAREIRILVCWSTPETSVDSH